MKVAPEKTYEHTVYFNEMLSRWFVKFSSTKYDIQYEFPLTDSYTAMSKEPFQVARPSLGWEEEGLLALVFSQMVATVRSAVARAALAKQVNNLVPGPTPGSTESELVTP